MEQAEPVPLAPHEVIAERVKTLRKGRGWSAELLAEKMSGVGIPWSRVVVAKLETGRRPGVSVEEFLALAYVLEVAPVHLVVPPLDAEDSDRTPYQLMPNGPVSAPSAVRAWIRGQMPIGSVSARRYFTEVPDGEWSPPAWQWSPENIDAQSRAVGDDGER